MGTSSILKVPLDRKKNLHVIMTYDLIITKYDSELLAYTVTSLHGLKLLQWFKESGFGKIKDIPQNIYSLKWV